MTNRIDKKSFRAPRPQQRVMSMRLVMTVASVFLVAGSVLGVGSVAERNARKTLSRELETRLVLEARSLASLSSSALLSKYPELTLHPVIKEMRADRPELGLVVVVDHEGVIQGHAEAKKLGTRFDLDLRLDPVSAHTVLDAGEVLLGNEDFLVVRRPILHPNGETIGAAVVGLERRHIEESLLAARRAQMLFLIPILGAAILLTMILMSVMLRPIGVLRAGLERIGQGDLDARLNLRSGTELGLLARSVNEMASALKSAQSELVEKERLDHEMELAREIQRSLLPQERVTTGDYVIDGVQEAAESVGGDYFDVFFLPGGGTGLIIADVAGKGFGGCLVMSMIAVLIRTLAPSHSSPSSLLAAVDQCLAGSLQPGTFITVFYGILDPAGARLRYASAGHNPLLHYRAGSGEVDWYKTKGIPLGITRDEALRASLGDEQIEVHPGDLLMQFTDGISEAMNGSGEEFGFDRISKIVRELAPRGAQAVISGLQRTVAEWEKPLPAADDKTLLVISRAAAATTARPAGPETPAAVSGDERTRARGRLVNRLWQKREEQGAHFAIPAALEALDEIGGWLRRCDGIGELSADHFGLLEQGLYEICGNIAEHGCRLDRRQMIDVWWIPNAARDGACSENPASPPSPEERVGEGYFLIRDTGIPPDAEKWPLSDPGSPRSRREGRGLGLGIIRKTLHKVEFHPATTVGNITIVNFKVRGGTRKTRR